MAVLSVDMRRERRPRGGEIADLAKRQHGVVAFWQLTEFGFGEGAIQRRIETGWLHPVHKGVYAVGHPLLSLNGKRMAAVFACGAGALLSHRDAAALWGLLRTSRSLIDVIVPRKLKQRAGIRVHRTRRLHPDDIAVRDGIPVTSVARTLLDLAEVVTRRQLERAVDEAERLGLFDLRAIDELLSRSNGRHGAKKLRAVIADAVEPPATRTEIEQRFADFCRDANLPRPAFNVSVEGFEVDAAWLKQKAIVELDSWQFHGGRMTFESDRKRDTVLQLAGYRVIRVTWRRLNRDPHGLAKDLKRLLTHIPEMGD